MQHDDGQHQPDVVSRFTSLRNALEDLSNDVNETLGEHHALSLKVDLIWARCLDLADLVESISCGTYD